MINNFMNRISIFHLEDEKFYGYFGYPHVLQSPYGRTSPFAHKLKRSGIFPDQICSLVALPVESESYFPKTHSIRLRQEKSSDCLMLMVRCWQQKELKILRKSQSRQTFAYLTFPCQHFPITLRKDWLRAALLLFEISIQP